MPNHITNRITSASLDTLKHIAELLKSDRGPVDFERLIPMPSDIIRGDLTMTAREASNGRNWYDWSVDHWGTKWNAYSVSMEIGAIIFETAWSCPEPIIRKLAEVAPYAWLWCYADEDIPHNCGEWSCDRYGKLTHADRSGDRAFALLVKGWEGDE